MTERDLAKGGAPLLGRLEMVTVIAVLGVIALAVGIFALLTPAKATVTKHVSFTNSGQFSYSAHAKTHSVYGSRGLVTGDPIVVASVGPVHVGFDYSLRSDVPAAVHGTAGIAAKVQGAGGLSRTFPIVSAKRFTGSHVRLAGNLPIAAISSYVNAASSSLGSIGTPTATVEVVPTVKVAGSLHGRALTSAFAPKLPFSYDGSSLTLSQAGSTTGTTQTAGLLKPLHTDAIAFRATVPHTVGLPFIHPSRSEALAAGFAGLLLCVCLAAWIGRPLLRRGGAASDRDRFRAMYGSMLVPVQKFTLPRCPVADVSSMGALIEVAKRYESVVMHRPREHGDDYMVWDNGMLYRYRIGEPAPVEREATELPTASVTPPGRSDSATRLLRGTDQSRARDNGAAGTAVTTPRSWL